MARGCCEKPIVRIIKVAEFEAGLVGLDQALHNVYASGLDGEEEIQRDLLKWIKEFGNYLSPAREPDYGKALMREYREFAENMERERKSDRDKVHKP
jgi:hypothetical protein